MTDLDDLQHSMGVSRSLARMLNASSIVQFQMPPLGEHSLLDDVRPLPRWPSGLLSDFDAIFDGFTGLTVLAGPGGSGKSLHALSCALENAMTPGTCVGYFDAENALGDQISRAINWFGGADSMRSNMERLSMHFHWFEVLPGMSWEQLMMGFAKRILHDHDRALIVLDSVSSLARCFDGNPLNNASRIYSALVALVRRSEGRIRVLALSELNKEGAVKGLEGVYASSLALKLTIEEDQGERLVRLNMLKNRSGQFRADLGLYEIDYRASRLRRADAHAREQAHQAAH